APRQPGEPSPPRADRGFRAGQPLLALHHRAQCPGSERLSEADVPREVVAADAPGAELECDTQDLGTLAQIPQRGRIEVLEARVVTDLEDIAAELCGAVDHPLDAQRSGIAVGALPEQGVGADADLHG